MEYKRPESKIIIILLFLLGAVKVTLGLSVFDFESRSSACVDKFSCTPRNSSREYFKPECRCDADCIHYGECCYNAPKYDSLQQIKNVRRHQCISGTRMFTKCSDGWENLEVERLCENHSLLDLSEIEEPILHIPVTSKITNFTYSNYFCAMCNNDAEDIRMWRPEMQCFTVNDKSPEENLDILKKHLHLDISDTSKDWKIIEDNENKTSDGLTDDEKILQYFKANAKMSKMGGKLIISNPLNTTDAFMECSIGVPADKYLRQDRCRSSVNMCAANWTDKETEDLCLSFSAPINYSPVDDIDDSEIYVFTKDKPVTYRNIYCAKCNYIDIKNPCIEFFYSGIGTRLGFAPVPPLTIILQTPNVMQRANFDGSEICEENEFYVTICDNCNNLLSQITGEEHKKGMCIPINDRVNNSRAVKERSDEYDGSGNVNNHTKSSDINNSKTTNYTVNKSASDRNNTVNLNFTFSSSHENSSVPCKNTFIQYEYLGNNSRVLAPLDSNHSYTSGMCKESQGVTSYPKYFTVLGWLTLVGLAISILSISLHLTAFMLVEQLRNLPGMNLATLCICLLGGYCSFIAGAQLKAKPTACYVTASIMYFSFFASLCWMSVIAYDTWASFKAITLIYTRIQNKREMYTKYSLYSWTLSVMALGFVVTIDKLEPTGIPDNLLPKFGVNICWFGQNNSLLIFFVLPMIITSIVIVSLFIATVISIAIVNDQSSHTLRSNYKRNLLRGNLRLAASMGVTWITGVIAWCMPNAVTEAIFIVSNALQGAFIFIAFTCKREVWEGIVNYCLGVKKKRVVIGNLCRSRSPNMRQQRRMELLHVSKYIDNYHQPGRVHGVYDISSQV